MEKRLIDTATKTGMDKAKTPSKRVVQKTAKGTGDLIGNKQLIKLLHQVKQRVIEKRMAKKKEKKSKKSIYHQKKDSKLLMI